MKLLPRQFVSSIILDYSFKVILISSEDEGLLSIKSNIFFSSLSADWVVEKYYSSDIINNPQFILKQEALYYINNKKRFIYIKYVNSIFSSIVLKFLSGISKDILFLEAPFLSRSSNLYKMCTSSKLSCSIYFYQSTLDDREILIFRYFPYINNNLKKVLLSLCSVNLFLVIQELSSLSLFCINFIDISEDIIEDFFSSISFANSISLNNCYYNGFLDFCNYYIFFKSIEKIYFIRQAIYYLLRLFIVRSDIENNIRYHISIKKLKPSLLFFQENIFKRDVKIFSCSKILEAIVLLQRSEILIKNKPDIDFTPLVFQLIQLIRMV